VWDDSGEIRLRIGLGLKLLSLGSPSIPPLHHSCLYLKLLQMSLPLNEGWGSKGISWSSFAVPDMRIGGQTARSTSKSPPVLQDS
jgi:hypothetical protein